MGRYFDLHESVIDKKTGKEAVIVYISEKVTDSYLVEPIDNSYDLEWRYGDELGELPKKIHPKRKTK